MAVLLASYNGGRHIRQQLLSIIWQQSVTTCVFVRDDGSTDATMAQVEEVRREYPDRVTVINDGLGSSGSAAQNFFNLLVAWSALAANFDFVALADQDDIWIETKLERALSQMRQYNCDGYSSNLIAFASAAPSAGIIRKDRAEVAYDHLFQTASAGCTYVLSRAAAVQVADKLAANAPNPDVAHDIVIYAIVRSFEMSWHHDAEAHILYRQHGENLVGARRGWAGLAARWRLIRSGWYRRQTMALRPYLSGREDEMEIVEAVSSQRLGDRLWLACRAFSCRRRHREAIVFAVAQFL